MDRWTGAPLSGWPHVLQSIAVILTTPIGSRVMRREFGSEVPDLIDRPMTSSTVLALYAATADALARWEPRFRLTGVRLETPRADGSVALTLRGTYQGETVTGVVPVAPVAPPPYPGAILPDDAAWGLFPPPEVIQ